MDEWRSYPASMPGDVLSIDDSVYHSKILLAQSDSLFGDDGGNLELDYMSGFKTAALSESGPLKSMI